MRNQEKPEYAPPLRNPKAARTILIEARIFTAMTKLQKTPNAQQALSRMTSIMLDLKDRELRTLSKWTYNRLREGQAVSEVINQAATTTLARRNNSAGGTSNENLQTHPLPSNRSQGRQQSPSHDLTPNPSPTPQANSPSPHSFQGERMPTDNHPHQPIEQPNSNAPQSNVQQAIIRGNAIDLQAILTQHGLTGQYVVEHDNGITAYFHHGPTVLEQIRTNLHHNPANFPKWQDLTHSQQRTVLDAVAGSVPWALDQDVNAEGIDEALQKDPELSRLLSWPPEAE